MAKRDLGASDNRDASAHPDHLDAAVGTTEHWTNSRIEAQRAQRHTWAIAFKNRDEIVLTWAINKTYVGMLNALEEVHGVDPLTEIWAAACVDNFDNVEVRSSKHDPSLVDMAVAYLNENR